MTEMSDRGPILTLEAFLPYRLSVLSNTISRSIADLYAERFGLTIPAWRVMAVLARFPGLSAGEVADRTAMDKVAVSRAVAQLQKAGFLARKSADDDRRRSVLALSEEGWTIYGQVSPLAIEMEKKLLAALSAEERDVLDSLIDKLTDCAREMGGETDGGAEGRAGKAYGAVV